MQHLLKHQASLLRFFLASLLLCLYYRVLLLTTTYQIALDPIYIQLALICFGFLNDLIAMIILTTFFASISVIVDRKSILQILFLLIYISITILYLIHLKIFSNLYIGINYLLISAYLHQGWSAFSLFNFTNPLDIFITLLAIITYFALHFMARKNLKNILIYMILPFYLLAIVYGATTFLNLHIIRLNNRLITLYQNPLEQVLNSYITSFNAFNTHQLAIRHAQLHSVKLIDPDFVHELSSTKSLSHASQPWNIVIFVLESVGSEYIFTEIKKDTIPMPFLKWLSQRSVWFENNYSGGNISALGQFSILTGIYPNPTPTHFELQDNIKIPTIATWLGNTYDSFFVTASNNLYAPKHIFESFSEYDNVDVISPDNKQLFFHMFMDERKAFAFFKQRLQRAKSPYLALYWSGAPHFPYNDYHFEKPLLTNIKDPYARYINNLRLLDQEIEATYLALRKQNLLDHTIFIIVGDHGDMFQQHDKLVAHGRSLYTEEIKVPLLIYAPPLFNPTTIHTVTSNIDILPTVLDALKIDYGNKLQGQSYFRDSNRKYVFIYGDQDEIAAINLHNVKMNISFLENTCTVYDLNKDPKELSPLPCRDIKQQEAILKFRQYQPHMLNWYNHYCHSNPTCS